MAVALLAGLAVGTVRGNPVAFTFSVAPDEREPFAREIWADVTAPSGPTIRLPAFYAGDGQFAVRARADEAGVYRLGQIHETIDGRSSTLPPLSGGELTYPVETPTVRPHVRISGSPSIFVFNTGESYLPLGANLAWTPEGAPGPWYRHALRQYSAAGLNWARIWMAHWGRLNLDWLPTEETSPTPGVLDPSVAKDWDAIVADAQRTGVYLQIVLQHHGQYSSAVNPNWDANPWNAANPGGFLRSPTEFFTSEKAKQLTKQKFRYIVARWGYSPSVLAWELFNEVHWVDAIRLEENVEAVAAWHDEMATHLRSIDVYQHLITTSTDDLHSPIYRSMDYLQPHLYATNMLAAVRQFDVPPAKVARPIFYGEVGNDHMRLTPEQAEAGVELAPLAWAGVMGEGRYPAQLWEGAKLLATGRLQELGALAQFLNGSDWTKRDGLRAISAAVEGGARVPLLVSGTENWQRRAPVELEVPIDGRQPLEFATIPRIITGSPQSRIDGYPSRVAFRLNYPRAATARVRLADAAPVGAGVQVRLDSDVVATHAWAPLSSADAQASLPRAVELSFAVSAGSHVIAIENTGQRDWFDFESLDTGLEVPALAAVGRQGADFVALWVWHREGVFALKPATPTAGRVLIDDVPAGRWEIVWWDSQTGVPRKPEIIDHDGGQLAVSTPPIARHAAVTLARR